MTGFCWREKNQLKSREYEAKQLSLLSSFKPFCIGVLFYQHLSVHMRHSQFRRKNRKTSEESKVQRHLKQKAGKTFENEKSRLIIVKAVTHLNAVIRVESFEYVGFYLGFHLICERCAFVLHARNNKCRERKNESGYMNWRVNGFDLLIYLLIKKPNSMCT